MKVNFTAGRIAAFACPSDKTQAFLWDTDTKGLGLKASPGGSKQYVLEARTKAQKTVRITIGAPSAWSIEDARVEARRLKTLIDRGIDPRQERKASAEAAEAARLHSLKSESAAMDIWRAYCTERSPRWSEAHRADHETVGQSGGKLRTRGRRKGEGDTTQPGILRPLLALPLAEINADQVRAWLKTEAAKRPTHARLAFGLLRAFLNWCAHHPEFSNYAHPDACAARLARDELPKKSAKNDCLQREQLQAWFSNVQAIRNPVIAGYLQVTLLSGARREEIAGIRWEDVDFAWNTLTIKDKVEGQRTIPLTPYVARLLRDLKARSEIRPPIPRRLRQSGAPAPAWAPSPWVFYSPAAASGRLQEPRIQHNKACAAAGIEGLTIHGLRRSFGTLAEWVECPAGVVAQIQGHKPSATAEKHYRRRPIDLLRMWHTKIESWILEQAGIHFDASAQPIHLRAISAIQGDAK